MYGLAMDFGALFVIQTTLEKSYSGLVFSFPLHPLSNRSICSIDYHPIIKWSIHVEFCMLKRCDGITSFICRVRSFWVCCPQSLWRFSWLACQEYQSWSDRTGRSGRRTHSTSSICRTLLNLSLSSTNQLLCTHAYYVRIFPAKNDSYDIAHARALVSLLAPPPLSEHKSL